MGVTRDDIDWIADLARLRLEPDEAEELTEDLNEILRHMDTLGEASVEPERAAPTDEAHREGGAPLRDGRSDPPDRLRLEPSRIAPGWSDGFFVVPKLPAVDAATDRREAGSDRGSDARTAAGDADQGRSPREEGAGRTSGEGGTR